MSSSTNNTSFQPGEKVKVIGGKFKDRTGVVSRQKSDQENMVWVDLASQNSIKPSGQTFLFGFSSLQKIN